MKLRELMRGLPSWVFGVISICLTVAFVSIVGSLVYLTTHNADTTSVMQFVNTVFNFTLLVVAGTGTAAAAVAAKSAQAAERQTNGEFKPRIKDAVHEVLDERNGGTDG